MLEEAFKQQSGQLLQSPGVSGNAPFVLMLPQSFAAKILANSSPYCVLNVECQLRTDSSLCKLKAI